MLDPINLSSEYFEQNRTDILLLIPNTATNLLEFGCGYGQLGKAIAKRQTCNIHGVELNPKAKEKLEVIYNKYWISDIEQFDFNQLDAIYDCIIFPDVLEHLTDPWSIINKSVNHLSLNGNLIASIPNIRNFAIIYRLIFKGAWNYEPHGILDNTHLRFFTRSSIIEMFENAGLEIEEIRVNKDNHQGIKGWMSKLAECFIKDINVCQFLIKAKVKNA